MADDPWAQFDPPSQKASADPWAQFDPPTPREKTFVEKTPLVANFPESYGKARSDATSAMSRGVEQVGRALSGQGEDKTLPFFGDRPELGGITASEGVRGLGNLIAGGVGYVTSPIMGAIDAGLGKPVQEQTGGAVPRELTNFAASLAVPGMGLTNVGKAAPASSRVVTTPKQQVLEAAGGLTERGMPVDVSRAAAADSFLGKQAGQRLGDVPFVGDKIGESAKGTIEQLGSAKQTLAAGQTAESAGQSASQGIVGWITGESKALVKKAYDAVDSAIDPSVTSPLENTRGVIADIAARRQNAAIPGDSKAVNTVMDAVQRPGGLNYAGVKDMRTFFRDMTPQEMVANGVAPAEAKQIYGALTKDLKATVDAAGGPRGRALWERANRVAELTAQRRESLATLVGEAGDAPAARVIDKLAAAARSGSRQDSVLLAQAKRVMGEDWKDVAQGVVEGMGKGSNGEFSPQIFINNYRGRNGFSQSGRDLLFGDSGNLRQSLDDIATVSQKFNQLQRLANPSGSGRTLMGGGLMMEAPRAGMALLSGAWVEPLTFLSSVVGGHVLARVLANPATASSAAKYTRAYAAVARNQSPTSVSALARASRNFGATIESNMKVPNPANDLMNVIGGPRRSAAQEPQNEAYPQQRINQAFED